MNDRGKVGWVGGQAAAQSLAFPYGVPQAAGSSSTRCALSERHRSACTHVQPRTLALSLGYSSQPALEQLGSTLSSRLVSLQVGGADGVGC